MGVFMKHPHMRVDYMMKWSAAYLGNALIIGSQWHVEPSHEYGLVVDADSHDGVQTMVTLSGGQIGKSYDAVNRVELSNGEIAIRSLTIKIEAQ